MSRWRRVFRRQPFSATWCWLAAVIGLANGYPAVASEASSEKQAVAQASPASVAHRRAQRELFRKRYQEALNGKRRDISAVEKKQLAGYPIAHYLDFALITAGFDDRSVAENSRRVLAYLADYADSPVATRLRHRYLSWLARREHWQEYTRFYQPAGATVSEQCHALWAQARQRPSAGLHADIEKLWMHGETRPAACGRLFTWWKAQGELSPQRLQQRFLLAFDQRNLSLARKLAGDMKKTPDWVRYALDLLEDPPQALSDAMHWPATDRIRQLVYHTALYQAQKAPAWLRPLWPKLRRHFGFDVRQHHQLMYRLALFAATDYEPFAIKAMKSLPADWQDDQLRAWQVRYWLHQQRWRQVAKLIESMPQTQRSRDRWQYWLARAYAKTGQVGNARRLFARLAKNADYYGFLSADHLRMPYQICQQDSPLTAVSDWQPPAAIERAIELYHVGLVGFAKREWNRAYYGLSREQKLALAERVQAEGWHNKLMAIMADTGNWKDYRRRFPHTQTTHIRRQALAAGLSPEWIMAVIRSESGWDPQAESHARARGLMQLIDSTARRLSRKLGVAYTSPQQLFDPVFNTTLGIAYQRELFERYQNHPLLSAAAYNAGETAAGRWLDDFPRSPDIWLETIPYRETRDYIPRILAYTVIYDWLMNQKPRRMTHFMPTVPVNDKPPGPWPSRSLPQQFADVVCRMPRMNAQVAQAEAGKSEAGAQ